MTKSKNVIPRNENQYSCLCSEYFIAGNSQLDLYSHKAHDLYNRALYDLRQGLFHKKYIKGYSQLDTMFKHRYLVHESMLYHELGYVQSAQQTLKEVCGIWRAWYRANEAFKQNPAKFTGKPRLPHYLPKKQRHIFFVTNQNAKLKQGYLTIPKLKLRVKLAPQVKTIQRVAFKPIYGGYKLIVQYRLNRQIQYLPDNGTYLGIDPGIDNALTCVSNTHHQPLLINGRNLKSVNQYYNQERSHLKRLQAQYHQLESTITTKQGPKPVYQETHAMRRITAWRNAKIKQFAHKASKRIVDYALNCGANTIVIGKNKSWKRSSNLGKRNNQNLIGIPHQVMINLIQYKANLVGISVIQANEAYTSQTSALDGEKPCWANGNKSRQKQGKSPINRRIRRGLFKANDGTLINADVNGAWQIIKKAFPKASFADGIAGVVLHPVKWTPLI
ncbi:RNA-guided endonuclease InsQ/TnpB family protein [Limosilactobacillus sp.]|jgi:putative transposase|uniref:RNA-guided endonuclease InsQ/TnpB family protein n=1 Tax=Limosilactobacillus sp. TaxID=2773925 RepID=UPI0035A17961